jgi:hypothetical protein
MHGGGEQLELLKVQDLVGSYFKKADDVRINITSVLLNFFCINTN